MSLLPLCVSVSTHTQTPTQGSPSGTTWMLDAANEWCHCCLSIEHRPTHPPSHSKLIPSLRSPLLWRGVPPHSHSSPPLIPSSISANRIAKVCCRSPCGKCEPSSKTLALIAPKRRTHMDRPKGGDQRLRLLLLFLVHVPVHMSVSVTGVTGVTEEEAEQEEAQEEAQDGAGAGAGAGARGGARAGAR